MLKDLRGTLRREKVASFIGVLSCLLALESGYFLLMREFSARLPFGIRIANAELSLIEKNVAESILEQRIAEYLKQPVVFVLESRQIALTSAEIGLSISAHATVERARGKFFTFADQPLVAMIDVAKLRTALLAREPMLEVTPISARFDFDTHGALVITSDTSGRALDFLALAEQIRTHATRLASTSFPLVSHVVSAPHTSAELALYQTEFEKLALAPFVLKDTEYHRFELQLAQRLEWFDFDLNYLLADREAVTLPRSLAGFVPFSGTPRLRLNRSAVEHFVTHELDPLVVIAPHAVKITRELDDTFAFEGTALVGRVVDIEQLITEIEAALAHSTREITIPYMTQAAPVLVSEELKALGIQTLLGSMETNYVGSPANRQANIRLATAKLNGRLIAPDEEFSFVSALGPITTEAGYRNELVIKEGDTVPEIGGGVCQVSTTIFRTALMAGLPIIAQKPHTLKVRYYDPPGLDATIYPGQADLKFRNDTGAPILIQMVIDGTRLRVNFYGTNDGRSARLVGPLYPDGKPIQNLARAGLRMYWERFLSFADGTEKQERYDAAYKVLPKK